MKYIILANLHHQDGKEIHKHTLKKKQNKQRHTHTSTKYRASFLGQEGSAANYHPPQFAPTRKKGNT